MKDVGSVALLIQIISNPLKDLVQSSISCKGMRIGKHAIAHSCEHYYVCIDGGQSTGQLKKCPKHKNFHPVYGKCVWTYVYPCVDPMFCKNKMDGKYKNNNNCYGYYLCTGKRTFPMSCPHDYRFNGKQCVDASRYVCPPSPDTLEVVA